MPSAILGIKDGAGKKTDQNPCPPGASVPLKGPNKLMSQIQRRSGDAKHQGRE